MSPAGTSVSIERSTSSISLAVKVTLFPALSVAVISNVSPESSTDQAVRVMAELFPCVILPPIGLASQVIVSPSGLESVAFTIISSAATPFPFTAAASSTPLSGEIRSPEVTNTGTSLSTLEFVVSATGPVLAPALLTLTVGLIELASIFPAL